jgi:NADP-dependent 3-hydroxy acid dehydrogenase YdfG
MADKQVLVITGASTGIGEATARRAVEFDYAVVLAARSEDKLEALANDLGDDNALAVRCDVTSWDDQQALVKAAVDGFGRMDAFLANAGFGAKRGFLEESVEHWKSMIDTNVLGAALSIRAALGYWRDNGNRGHMLLTSSVAGRRTMPGSLYSATKWAVTAMGHALRAEVADTDIKTTLIEPGMVDTPFFDDKPDGALEPDDIARAVMFALTQPPGVDVNEILVRPIQQAG